MEEDDETDSGESSEQESDEVQSRNTGKTYSRPNNLHGLKELLCVPLNLLLVTVPLGIISKYAGWNEVSVFWINFVALVPLAKILGDATEELANNLKNDTVGGLLNATFGNAVELVLSVQSIRAGLLDVVKATLLGSVLSNILLVLGTALLCGGLTLSEGLQSRSHSYGHDDLPSRSDSNLGIWRFRCNRRMEKEQKFGAKTFRLSMALLLFSCMSFVLPSIFNGFPTDDSKSVLFVSRIGSCFVVSCYLAFLLFQLVTHKNTIERDEQNEEEEIPETITTGVAVVLMAVCTIVVAVNSEMLVDAIEAVVKKQGIPESFIGVILLPIAGNACEHAGAIRFAMHDRLGLAIGIAVGSSTQVALLVVPLTVIIAWSVDQPLDLDYGLLNSMVVFMSILVVSMLLNPGRSNWLKGYILVCMYLFISILYWFAPLEVPSSN
eukprot:TRINITY_DN31160_c0_g1_i1.p1 TRINITY_DN31160_c0_g1~~TRINITY_DN31160_c0_g1_i1.p1  ORF type:complete len:437 (+),score=82.90 TRINITY_DN31160_c0_g1_i1:162-1472(+)